MLGDAGQPVALSRICALGVWSIIARNSRRIIGRWQLHVGLDGAIYKRVVCVLRQGVELGMRYTDKQVMVLEYWFTPQLKGGFDVVVPSDQIFFNDWANTKCASCWLRHGQPTWILRRH